MHVYIQLLTLYGLQGLVGLSENDFAAKMKLLEQERQQRIQVSH